MTVPAGLVHGLPVGLSFFGVDWSEAQLFRIAAAFERETQARSPPYYRAPIGYSDREASRPPPAASSNSSSRSRSIAVAAIVAVVVAIVALNVDCVAID